MPNPNIAKAGAGTRFKAGNTAATGRTNYGMPGSVGYALKGLLRQTIKIFEISSLEEFERSLERTPTPVDLIALHLVQQSAKCKFRALRLVTRLVDGPTPDPNREIRRLSREHEAILKMSDHEILMELEKLQQTPLKPYAANK